MSIIYGRQLEHNAHCLECGASLTQQFGESGEQWHERATQWAAAHADHSPQSRLPANTLVVFVDGGLVAWCSGPVDVRVLVMNYDKHSGFTPEVGEMPVGHSPLSTWDVDIEKAVTNYLKEVPDGRHSV